jgi:hypothetical protein
VLDVRLDVHCECVDSDSELTLTNMAPAPCRRL